MTPNKHKNNLHIVSAQLDAHRSELFTEMRTLAGMTITEALKAILNPIIDGYEESLKETKAKAALQALGVKEEDHD